MDQGACRAKVVSGCVERTICRRNGGKYRCVIMHVHTPLDIGLVNDIFQNTEEKNQMANKIIPLALAGAAALLSQLSFAHVGGKANAGYVGDASGHLVTDGRGECVRTNAWTKDLALSECEHGMAPKKAAAVPETTPTPVAVVPAPVLPTPIPEPVLESVTLKAGALFDSGKAELKPAGRAELDELVAKLKSHQNIESIKVTGHTDSQGAAAYNQKLSEQRAAAVKTNLVQNGIDEKVISTVGAGDAQPIASNATAASRAQNRRVQLEIKTQQQVVR